MTVASQIAKKNKKKNKKNMLPPPFGAILL